MEKMLHAYILTGSGEATLKTAWDMAAAALCESRGARPCGVCRHCRKVTAHIHPDVALIERVINPKTGKLYKDILVSQIRELSTDASVLPNEAAGKVYIFPRAEEMNPEAQNAFLKLLEEPPRGVSFLLCTESRAALLETVRSRCAEKRVGGAQNEPSEQSRIRAEEYLAALHDRAQLWRLCVNMEKLEPEQLAEVVEGIRTLAVRTLRDTKELLALEAFLDRAAQYLRANIPTKHVTGYLATYLYDTK